MTEREYRMHPAVSRSELWKISESPEKFKYYKENPRAATPALVFGQAFHKLALEPESFGTEFAVLPNCDRRTKEGKAIYAAFENSSNGKTVITSDTFNQISEMANAMQGNIYAKRLLEGEHEKPFFWIDDMTGEECKCRADCLTELNGANVIVDIKTAMSADTETFMRDAIKYGYDFQAAMYSEGVSANTKKQWLFVFIVIEKEPPYAINILQADNLVIRRGKDVFRELIGIYHDCRMSGEWYGYLGKFNMINNLSLPAWLAKEVE